MIKVYNKKSLKEIEELREKGLYNAPFAVHESANGLNIGSADTKALEKKIKSLEDKLESVESKDVEAEAYDDSKLLEKIENLGKQLSEANQTIEDYVSKTDKQAKTIAELNKDLDVLVGDDHE